MRVAIVGAGPAGASLALLLARRGVGVVLAERHTDFAREFRGEGLLPGGVDALQQMGLGASLDSLPQSRVDRIQLYQERRPLFTLDIPATTGVAAGPRFVSQPALLEMLVAEASRHPELSLRARLHRARSAARGAAGRGRARRHAPRARARSRRTT